jgi:nucleotide-binding universal stress UspA family protein
MTETELRNPKTILLPLDGSGESATASRCAELIAVRFGAKVVLLGVVEPVAHPFERLGEGFDRPSREEAVRDELRSCAHAQFSGIQPEIRVVSGDPARMITATAEELEADLIVMPTRGKGAFRRFLLGSTTAKVLNDVAVPILTTAHVEDATQSCLSEGIKIIVCGVALDSRAKSVCQAATLVAEQYNASLVIVHAPEGHDAHGPDKGRGKASEALESILSGISRLSEVRVESGRPDYVVPAVAREVSADLVVIGRSSPGPLGRLRAQSYGIIRDSPCPVLSV